MAGRPGEAPRLGPAALDCPIHGDSSYPLSFPSQPPDIKNWFSSYEYESPQSPELNRGPGDDESETQDPFECYGWACSPESELALPKRDGQDDSLGIECVPCSLAEIDLHEQATREEESDLTLPENGIGETFPRKDLLRMCESKRNGGTKRKQSLRHLFGEGFLDDCEEIAIDCSVSSSTEKSPCEDQEQKAEQPADSLEFGLSDTEESPSKNQEQGQEVLSGSEENREDEINHGEPLVLVFKDKDFNENAMTNGFVSTKNKEKSREDGKCGDHQKHSRGRDEQTSQENNEHSEWKCRAQGGIRRPLGDRTNVTAEVAEQTTECRGKWKCPRKSKPYTGPPAKQLRLERWVHRVK